MSDLSQFNKGLVEVFGLAIDFNDKEIMEYLGVSRDTVLDWIERRYMPAAKFGRLWKFKVSEVDAWMKSGVAADK